MIGAEAQSERSIITLLSVDMAGSTSHLANLDPDDAQAFLDHWFDRLRTTVERSGGFMVSFEGDGGIALFGWPSALEDHADRACVAAWDLCEPVADACGPSGAAVRFRVGVHSGLVGLRSNHRDGRSRFDMFGPAVNVAVKLQQSASPGHALVSSATAHLCRASPTFTPHNPPPLIGGAPIEAFNLEGAPDQERPSGVASRYQTPMIGRDEELALLREGLPRPGGANAVVALIGEPGIGKSRLAAAIIEEARSRKVATLSFEGDALKRATPFAVARALLSSLYPDGGPLGEALAGLLPPGSPPAGELDAVVNLLALTGAPSARGSARLSETRIARALVIVFCALALDRPTLLLIEDLHFVDSESLRFLRRLAAAKTPHPMFLLVTARPEAEREAAQMASAMLHLRALPRGDMEALGRCLWHVGDADVAALTRVIDRAEGIPFVLEEMIRSVAEESETSALPSSVTSAIHARVHRLAPGPKAAAQALSLLGDTVEIEFLRSVMDAEAGVLLGDLAELERFAFVHPLAGSFARFRHQIIAEACGQTVSRPMRQGLHRAALRALVSRFPDPGGRYGQLAFHAEGAGDDTAALDYLWEAAIEARRSSADASINRLFERSLVLADRIGAAAEDMYVAFVLMAFASMLQLGEFEKMNRHLPRTVELARRRGRPGQISSALSQLAMICWFDGRYAEGLGAAEEGLELARSLKSPALIYSNQLMIANLLNGMGHNARALAVLDELNDMLIGKLEFARLGAPSVPKATVLAFASWFMNATGQYAEGLGRAQTALDIAVREGDAYSEALARSSIGRNLLMLRRENEAIECLTLALQITEANGYDALQVNMTGCIAAALARAGRPIEAIERVETCLAGGLHARTGRMEVFYLQVGYAEALLGVGRLEDGLSTVEQCLAIAREISNPWLTTEALGMRARINSKAAPGNPAIDQDLRELTDICERHRLMPWTEGAANRSP
jgi:class 3 adenylate cyclase/tetratricopeptide (TPR) repeat protein